ncbi:efflux RND transporter permease subunit [Deltaproteobacteria bacterium TL4]
MSNIKDRIEQGFEAWGRLVFRHPWLIVFGALLITAALYSQLPSLTMDASMEGFLHPNDPVLLNYNAFRSQFGRDDVIVVAVRPKDVFKLDTLRTLRSFHKELEKNVPYLDDIDSIINARSLRGEDQELIVEELMKTFPETEEQVLALKKKIFATPPYVGVLIAKDSSLTTLTLRIQAFAEGKEKPSALDALEAQEGQAEEGEEAEDDDLELDKLLVQKTPSHRFIRPEQNWEAMAAVREIVAKYNKPDFKIYVSGVPTYSSELRLSMEKNIPLFLGLCVSAIGIFVFLLLRRFMGVIVSLFIVVLSLFGTLSLMAIWGFPITIVTQILPSFLLAVGIGDSIHILTIFYKCYSHGDSKEESIVYSVGHSGIPVVMTSLTTAGGLWSFSQAEVAPIADLGTVGGGGVIVAMIYTLVLLPAFLAILPVKRHGWLESRDTVFSSAQRVLTFIGNMTVRFPWVIMVVTVVVLSFSLYAGSTLKFTHHPLKWFPENAPFRIASEVVDSSMAGSLTLEFLIDTRKKNGIDEPEFMRQLEELGKQVTQMKFPDGTPVQKTLSIADLMKEIHQALNENNPEFYTVPQTRELVTQELFLFESSGSGDIRNLIDEQHSKARFTIYTPNLDAINYVDFSADVEKLFRSILGPEDDIILTGIARLVQETAFVSVKSMAESYVISIFAITSLMILFLGSIKIGLISMIPNIFPIIFMLAVINLFDFPLDLFTLLIGSIAMGLVVDDTIHFMHGFHRYLDQADNYHYAIHSTLQYTGRAMLYTTLILTSGFLVYTTSAWNNLFNFGLLSALCLIVALFADLFISPALMRLIYHDKE